MIVEKLMDIGLYIIDLLFSLIGALPDVPVGVRAAVGSMLEFMFSGINLLAIFCDISFVKLLIPIVIAILNFDKIAKLVIFIIKKIPLAGMQ